MTRLDTSRAGFSLLEALIATALVLIITLGVLPLFTNSVMQNVAGREATVATNHSRSSSEELISLPLDRDFLRPPPSAETREVCQEYEHNVGWSYFLCASGVDNSNPVHVKTWGRVSRVRQFSINEIYDDDTHRGLPTFNNATLGYPIDDDRFDSFVHVRELIVTTEGQRTEGTLGKGRRTDIIDVRGF